MPVRVVKRRRMEDNHAAVNAFGGSLARAFEDWARQPVSATLPSLTTRLQQIAEAAYEPAYLRGKRTVLPSTEMTAQDIGYVRGLLSDNRAFLEASLIPDILDKIRMQRLQGGEDTSKVLVEAFGRRIESLYGGTLWRLIEAGYAAGVRELAQAVRRRPRPIAQETLFDRMQRLAREKVAGGDLRATPATLARDRATVAAWNRSQEEEIARRTAAVSGIDAGEIAAALNITRRELEPALADPGFRIGTKYNAENDDATCDPCRENSEGGDGDGIYWEPDMPPIPGEDCDGYGNCRCTLETVYGS